MIKKHTVMAALRPEGVVAVQRALGEHAELVPVHSFEDAAKRLRGKPEIDAVLCGIYFGQKTRTDDSKPSFRPLRNFACESFSNPTLLPDTAGILIAWPNLE